jgi:hypothetical protein
MCVQHIYRGTKVNDGEYQGWLSAVHHFFLLLCVVMERSSLVEKQGLSYPTILSCTYPYLVLVRIICGGLVVGVFVQSGAPATRSQLFMEGGEAIYRNIGVMLGG